MQIPEPEQILLLKFAVVIEGPEHIPHAFRHNGPLFHRWLPNGEMDAITLDTGDPKARLKVWFERRGFVGDDGFIYFDNNRREVDPDVMAKQGILDAGALRGLLEIRGLSEEEVSVVRSEKIGDELYVTLGKRVVRKLLQPPLSRFLSILRANYGQYWIRNLEPWDSRDSSLGAYCHGSLQVLCSVDGGIKWLSFKPDQPSIHFESNFRREYPEYPTQRDWQELREAVDNGYEPSLAAVTLARAHEFSDQGVMRQAFIEGVTALEIAINEFIRGKIPKDSPLIEDMQAFWNLPRHTQLVTLASILDRVSTVDIESAGKAIKIRDKIIHEGWNPPEKSETILKALLTTVAVFLGGPKFRFPTVNPGNSKDP